MKEKERKNSAGEKINPKREETKRRKKLRMYQKD